MSQARTLGELKGRGLAASGSGRQGRDAPQPAAQAARAARRCSRASLGYDDTVVPQVANAVLSRHNMILLGLRGQAKSRLLRSLTTLLDPERARGGGLRDPRRPVPRRSASAAATWWREQGDETPIAWLTPDERYVEKLATPDVTIADIIGDVDPIRAARGGHDLASELTMHYGLLPRAHRGIFALNELPDLAGRIQVGLFNILQEGDVQIKGYPIRLPLDVVHGVHRQPRGLHRARQDHHAAQGPHRQRGAHALPGDAGAGRRHHAAGGLDRARAPSVRVPRFIREVVEGVAFAARRDKKVDKRSGVSAAPADQRARERALQRRAARARRRRGAGGAARVRRLRRRCPRSPASSSWSTRAS